MAMPDLGEWEFETVGIVGQSGTYAVITRYNGPYISTWEGNVPEEMVQVPSTVQALHSETSSYVSVPVHAVIGKTDYDGNVTQGAFEGNTTTTQVTLPPNCCTLGDRAFMGCNNLEYIWTSGNCVNQIGVSTFQNCSKLDFEFNEYRWLNLQDQEYVPQSAFRGCNLNRREIENILYGTTIIADYAFYDNQYTGVLHISLPSTIKYIGDNAFERTISIGDPIVYIDRLVLAGTITNITPYAFAGVVVDTFTFTSDTKYVTSRCFGRIPASNVIIPDNVVELSSYCFSGGVFTTVTLSNKLTTIPQYCFENCSNLHTIYMSSNTVNIGYSAFTNCYSLTTVYYPIISSLYYYKLKSGQIDVAENNYYFSDALKFKVDMKIKIGNQFKNIVDCYMVGPSNSRLTITDLPNNK